MTAPALPVLPAEWTYTQALDHEAALRSHMTEHGATPEAMFALAQTLLGRCAYRSALMVAEEALARWPELDWLELGTQGRLLALGAALHAGLQQEVERWTAELAGFGAFAPELVRAVARYGRGSGLQPAGRDLIASLRTCLDTDASHREQASTLVEGYAEAVSAATQVRLISLGSGCYPWLQPNRYMLRRVDAIDAMMPFNMCVAIESGIVAALEERFEAFFDAGAFDATTMLRGVPAGRLRRYAMLFNHDCDDSLLSDGLAGLRAVCAARAEAFLNHACSEPRVFVCDLPVVADLHRLETALAALMQDDSYRLLLLISSKGEAPELPVPSMPTTRVAHLPLPWPAFNWTLDDDTPEGIRRDLRMRRIVLNTMQELM